MFSGFGEGASDGLGGLHRQVLDRFRHHAVGFLGRELAPDDLQLLIDQVGQDLRHLLPTASLEELLLGRVAVTEGDRKPEPLQLGQVERPNARPGRRHGQNDQQPMQATRSIHVAERSTA